MKASPSSIYGFSVRQLPLGGAITAQIERPVTGVLHTTEGSTAEGAAQTFHLNGDPPHFAVDSGSIIQFRPLNQRAMSLRHSPNKNVFKGATNAFAVQIEIAGFSKKQLWIPNDATASRVAAVIAYSSLFHDIPWWFLITGRTIAPTCPLVAGPVGMLAGFGRKVTGPMSEAGGCTWKSQGKVPLGTGIVAQ